MPLTRKKLQVFIKGSKRHIPIVFRHNLQVNSFILEAFTFDGIGAENRSVCGEQQNLRENETKIEDN